MKSVANGIRYKNGSDLCFHPPLCIIKTLSSLLAEEVSYLFWGFLLNTEETFAQTQKVFFSSTLIELAKIEGRCP